MVVQKSQIEIFEESFDQKISELDLLKLPIRSVLSALYGGIDWLQNGDRQKGGEGRRPDAGGALASRLSYLAPHLIKCPAAPLGSDALDAMSPFEERPDLLEELKTFIEYGHFCELMPEVHRGYYEVSGNPESGFILTHPSPEVARLEGRDIVMAELAMPFYSSPPPIPGDFMRDRIDSRPDTSTLMALVMIRYDQIRNRIVDSRILAKDGYYNATGGSFEQFCDFRRACFAISDVCLAFANAYAMRNKEGESSRESEDFKEFLEWTRVCLKYDAVIWMIESLTKIAPKIINRLMDLFLVNFSAPKRHAAKDGFFPPFWRIDSDVIIFNPNVVQYMMSSRNIPFALNQLDPGRFDEFVSMHLEPALIDEVIEAISPFNAITRTGVTWDGGEADILIYEPDTNTVIHVQAKGAIPAQGARMVRAVEGRTREALEQLDRFRALPVIQRDAIISNAIGCTISNVTVLEVILVRSGIGSWKVWQKIGGAIPVNIPLLKASISKCSTENPLILSEVIKRIPSILDETVAKGLGDWETTSLKFMGVQFNIPLLQLNYEYLDTKRMKVNLSSEA